MLVELFFKLRAAGIPVSVTELLTLLEALERRVVLADIEGFYFLCRASLVKDERHFDRFDQVFEAHFAGLEQRFGELLGEIPAEWLRSQAERLLTDAEKRRIQSLGGWQKLMDTLRKRLEEQEARHQGGSKWIGTGGTSPYGHDGYNPEGVRIGGESRHRRAVKVWERREYRNYDDRVELGTRNIKLALRRLRKFAREGAAEELDLEDTIRSTARNAGLLDLRMVPERHNSARVLLFLDVGGSMDDHVRQCEELFSAARTEFKHLEQFYFHNFVYEGVWRDNRRRHSERLPTLDVIHKYGPEYRLVLVGDASMSPYEITVPGGAIEHWNEEAGAIWLSRLLAAYPRAAWLNPSPERHWAHTPSISITRELMADRMFPLTIEGLGACIDNLRKSH